VPRAWPRRSTRLAKDPGARFPNGEALADAFARARSAHAVAVRAFVTEARQLRPRRCCTARRGVACRSWVRCSGPDEPQARAALIAAARDAGCARLMVARCSAAERDTAGGTHRCPARGAVAPGEELAFLYGRGRRGSSAPATGVLSVRRGGGRHRFGAGGMPRLAGLSGCPRCSASSQTTGPLHRTAARWRGRAVRRPQPHGE